MANKKQRDNAIADAEMKLKREARGKEKDDESDAAGPADMLAAGDDDDVIF